MQLPSILWFLPPPFDVSHLSPPQHPFPNRFRNIVSRAPGRPLIQKRHPRAPWPALSATHVGGSALTLRWHKYFRERLRPWRWPAHARTLCQSIRGRVLSIGVKRPERGGAENLEGTFRDSGGLRKGSGRRCCREENSPQGVCPAYHLPLLLWSFGGQVVVAAAHHAFVEAIGVKHPRPEAVRAL